MVAPEGFEPSPYALERRCPNPLDQRAKFGASSQIRTGSRCLEGSHVAVNTNDAYGAPYPIRTDDLLITSELL